MNCIHGMSDYRRCNYLREQQRETKFAPHIHCKGPHIRDFENLSRAVFFPGHINTDGTLKVECIPSIDLTIRGFSIYRTKYTSREIIDNLIDKYLSRRERRKFEYVLIALAGAVRSCTDNAGYQAFFIVDDAPDKERSGHAIILCAEKYKRSYVKELRLELMRIINNPCSLDEAYPLSS